MNYIPAKTVAKMLNISKSTVVRYSRREDFPKAHRFSKRNVRFLMEDVLEWLKNQ